MPTLPLPLFTRSYRNADETVLTDDAAVQYNGFIDELGGLNIRPGEVRNKTVSGPVTGLYFWPDKNLVISFSNGYIYIDTIVSGFLSQQTLVASASLNTGKIVSFANNGTYVFMAAGGVINYITEAGVLAQITDADAPSTVTHIAYLDGYILAIDGTTGKFYWADVNAPTSWSALSFASAEANPDITQALHVVRRQIYLFGTTTLEVWENDGQTPFSRISGGAIEIGCGAKYSIVRRDDSLMWLTHTRQFARVDGTGVKFISSRYDKEIMNFTTVSDCVGGFVHHDGQEYCIFTFPTENRTLVYNPNIDDWSEWGSWDSTYMNWDAYSFNAITRDIVSGTTFIGKANTKVITHLSSSSTEDVVTSLIGAIDERPFKFLRRTGWISNGTNKTKRVEELSFRARRGASDVGDNSVKTLMLRYRNDGSSQWSNIKEIDLGSPGQTEHQISLKRLGVYKSRQWEISVTDNSLLSFAQAEIDFTVLR